MSAMATPEQEGVLQVLPRQRGSPSAQPATASSQPGSASTSAQVPVGGSVPTPGAPVQLPVPPTPTLDTALKHKYFHIVDRINIYIFRNIYRRK